MVWEAVLKTVRSRKRVAFDPPALLHYCGWQVRKVNASGRAACLENRSVASATGVRVTRLPMGTEVDSVISQVERANEEKEGESPRRGVRLEGESARKRWRSSRPPSI